MCRPPGSYVQVNKLWHMHITEYYFSLSKKILIHISIWMNLEAIILSDINLLQSKNTVCSLL